MKQNEFFLIIFLILCFLAIGPTQALAEGFMDIYGGWASTRDADIDLTITTTSFGLLTGRTYTTTESHKEKIEFGSSYTLGARVGGYWSKDFPYVGLAIDASYFKVGDEHAKIHVIPLSVLVMLRYPLFKNEKFPYGKIQPYAGIGPSLILSIFDVDFRPNLSENLHDSSIDLGLDVRAGMAWQFHKHLALFGEYRYTNFNISAKTEGGAIIPFSSSYYTIKTQLGTNHFLAGISYRF
jgi:outer membrane protein W